LLTCQMGPIAALEACCHHDSHTRHLWANQSLITAILCLLSCAQPAPDVDAYARIAELPPPSPPTPLLPSFAFVASAAKCADDATRLFRNETDDVHVHASGPVSFPTISMCAELCRATVTCTHFSYGQVWHTYSTRTMCMGCPSSNHESNKSFTFYSLLARGGDGEGDTEGGGADEGWTRRR